MSAARPVVGAGGRGASAGGRGASAGGDRGPWRCQHSGPGTYDESARRVSHSEYAVAQLLVQEGHHVRSVPESRGAGKTPDFVACGALVEAKSFESLAERRGRPPSAEGVANKLMQASEQGAVGIIWAGASGLSQATARAGYLLYCRHAVVHGLGKLESARVVGEGFDVSFDPVADVRAVWQAGATPRLRPSAPVRRLVPRP